MPDMSDVHDSTPIITINIIFIINITLITKNDVAKVIS